jgi:hypothetical protein
LVHPFGRIRLSASPYSTHVFLGSWSNDVKSTGTEKRPERSDIA